MRMIMAALAVALCVVPASFAVTPGITGSFQGWNPNDPAYDLTLMPNGVWQLTATLPLGHHEYKAVDGDAWGLDFPSANQMFDLAAAEAVTWYVNLGATVGTKQGDEYVFHSKNPPIVCGSFMSELGGTDWDQTNTTLTVMSDPDGDGIWEWQSVIPAGSYNFKIVLNNNWNQDTYPPSQNYTFGSDGVNSVLFRYHMANNQTEVFSAAPPMVVSATANGVGGSIDVKFSKDVEQTSAETPSNYTVLPTIGITGATRDATDHSLVHLAHTTSLSRGTAYMVTVTNVKDLQGRPVDPNHDTGCFVIHQVVFEVNMHLYVQAHGVPTSVHIQGDTAPLTWTVCGGSQAYDNGAGYDTAAGDTTYTVAEDFSIVYDCSGSPVTQQAKYKYIVDCVTWEGAYDFGHFVTLDPNVGSQRVNVWWEDVSPADMIACNVGVRFQVGNVPTCAVLTVKGSVAPLDWTTGVTLNDSGTNGDLHAGDGLYSALVTFPTGSYRYLQYKYSCDDVFECGTYPNRQLTLDDVSGCVAARVGPMNVADVWDWCQPVSGVPEGNASETSWGAIKALYRVKK
jgi:hypothetical protein